VAEWPRIVSSIPQCR